MFSDRRRWCSNQWRIYRQPDNGSFFEAVCPARAIGAALVMPYANTGAMNAHLAEIARHVSSGAHAILVVEGAGWHGSKDLVVPTNITLLRLPPYSPELNPVENIWQFLRQNYLANRVFESYDAIVHVCCNAWNALLKTPERVASITARDWAKVNGWCRWYQFNSSQRRPPCWLHLARSFAAALSPIC